MARRDVNHPTNLPHAHTLTLEDGRELSEGVEFTIRGEGRFRFAYVYTPDQSVACWGPVGSHYAQWRSFNPARITTIHKSRTPKATEKKK